MEAKKTENQADSKTLQATLAEKWEKAMHEHGAKKPEDVKKAGK